MTDRIEHARNEREIALWTRRLGIYTLVLAILTGIVAAISGVTAWILEKSDETARLRDRAFIYFENPSVAPYPSIEKPIIWGLSISVHNVGNLPARKVRVQYACPDSVKAEKVTEPFPLAKWQVAEISGVVGPKQTFELRGCEIPIATVMEARQSGRDLFYVVRAEYIDGFEKSRTTHMSRIFYFDQHGGMSLGYVGAHNCSDDDCPR